MIAWGVRGGRKPMSCGAGGATLLFAKVEGL